MLVEAVIPVRVKAAGLWRLLEPGKPVEFADEQAAKLISKVPNKVRQVLPNREEPIEIQPAAPTARPIYWESMDGTWHGPVKPEFLGRTGSGDREQFWVIVTYKGGIRWVCADLLRSRKAFECQEGREIVHLNRRETR